MSIRVIQKGLDNVSEEAGVCPTCGTKVSNYQVLPYSPSVQEMLLERQMQWRPDKPVQVLAATFRCPKCGCIWQWKKDDKPTSTSTQEGAPNESL